MRITSYWTFRPILRRISKARKVLSRSSADLGFSAWFNRTSEKKIREIDARNQKNKADGRSAGLVIGSVMLMILV